MKKCLPVRVSTSPDPEASSLNQPSLDTSIEAPPSLLPQKHYCDITGLEAPYTDPGTGLRYHDKSVYDVIKSLVSLFPCYLASLSYVPS